MTDMASRWMVRHGIEYGQLRQVIDTPIFVRPPAKETDYHNRLLDEGDFIIMVGKDSDAYTDEFCIMTKHGLMGIVNWRLLRFTQAV